MHPAQKRLKELKELLSKEKGNTLYAQDLKLSIKQAEKDIKAASAEGYRMVD